MAGSRTLSVLTRTAGTLASAIALASSPLMAAAQPAGPGVRPTPELRKGLTLVPTAAPLPADDPAYYPIDYRGPRDGANLRAATLVYDNSAGPYYIAADPPGGPPINGVMDGVQFSTANTWANGSPLTQISTVYRKQVSTPQSFLVIVRLFNTIDTTVPDPGNINLSPLPTSGGGTTVAFDPIASNGGVGNYLINLVPAGAWPGAAFTDNNLGIDIKDVLATPAPAHYLNPAFLHPSVTGNFFTNNPPIIGSEYPPGTGIWADQDSPAHVPPLFRNGDYQAAELLNFGPNSNIYLRITADVACQTSPPNDACAAAQVIPPPPAGGSVLVLDPTNPARSGTTTCATVDADAAAVYCAGVPTNPTGVWFKYAGQGRRVSVHTCGGSHGAYDSIITVFTGACAGGLACVNVNNDVKQLNTYASQFNCGPISSRVDFCAAAGADYFIFVRASGNAGGDFDLSLVDSGAPCGGPCTVTTSVCTFSESDGLGCGGDTNGSCATAIVFHDCARGLGTIDAVGGVVDVDTFIYTIPTGETGYTLRVRSEFPAFVIVNRDTDPTNPCQFITVNAGGQFAIPACTEYSITFSGAVSGDRHIITITTPNGSSPATCGTPGSHYFLAIDPQAACIFGPDCFTRGPAGPPGACGTPTHTRPQNSGHFARGGTDCFADAQQCMGDWDGDGCLLPADVAAFISCWFFSAQNDGNLDGDIDCDGYAVPVDVATFMQHWFNGINTPAAEGC